MEKRQIFSKWCWEVWIVTCKQVKLEHSFTSYTKINSKWFKYLNIRYDTIKLLEENIGKTFSDVNCSNIFIAQSCKAEKIIVKINMSCFSLSYIGLFVTTWTVACQAPLSMGFYRQEYWRGQPFLSPGDLPNPWTELVSFVSTALAGRIFTTSATKQMGPNKM